TGYGAQVVRSFEEAGHAVLNGSDSIVLARDKVRSLQVLARAGVPVPRTVSMRTLTGLDAALALVGGCPAIVKLQAGTQGVGTMIAETSQSVYSLLETFCAMGQDIVFQDYVR